MKLVYLFLLLCGLAAVSAHSVLAKKGSSGSGMKSKCFPGRMKISAPHTSLKDHETHSAPGKLPKIWNGDITTPREFPHHVAICAYGSCCGGSIINSKFALTAAQCVADVRNPASLAVLAGYWNLSAPTGGESILQAEKIIVHKGWGANGNCDRNNDIALIKIKETFNLSCPAIAAVELAERRARPTGRANVSGWGVTESGRLAQVLMKVDVAILDDAACKRFVGGTYNPTTMLCAGNNNNNKDACAGDNGGALVQQSKGWQQVGIVSAGLGCGEGPVVYTRLSYYRDWIDLHVKSHE